MTDVNDMDHEQMHTRTAALDAFTIHPSRDIYCLNPACEVYKEPGTDALVFWDTGKPTSGVRCLRCQTTWDDPTDLLRSQDAWHTPYHGLWVTALSGAGVWLLPTKLLPWKPLTKAGISALCLFAAVHLLLQLWRRQQRVRAHQLLGWLGAPYREHVRSEPSLHLEKKLSGKSASLDGALKDDLLALVQELALAEPLLHHVRTGLAHPHPLETYETHPGHAALTPDESAWVQRRLAWLKLLQQDPEAHRQDTLLATDLLEGILADLESLQLGDKAEKDDARAALQAALQEGRDLLQRLPTPPSIQ